MARDLITPVQTEINAGIDGKAATVMTVISVSNGAYIDASDVDTKDMIIHIKNTAGAEYDVTISAGDYATASLGDLVVPVAATSGEQLIYIDSSRFKDSSGHINIDFETSMTGLIGAYLTVS